LPSFVGLLKTASATLKMEAKISSEALVPIYKTSYSVRWGTTKPARQPKFGFV